MMLFVGDREATKKSASALEAFLASGVHSVRSAELFDCIGTRIVSLFQFAARLGISRSHLCDIEQGRRAVSPERGARFTKALKQQQAQFVHLALQDQVRNAGLRLKVHVYAA
jgi:DNA-binding transcriptional regulator YiaG